jgi:hypothetical protein
MAGFLPTTLAIPQLLAKLSEEYIGEIASPGAFLGALCLFDFQTSLEMQASCAEYNYTLFSDLPPADQ